MVCLIAFDQRLDPYGVGFAVTMTANRVRSAAGFNAYIGKEEARIDLHRRHMRDVNRFFLPANPTGLALHDAGRRDEYLGWKETIARAETARPKDVARRKR
jgi:hypothetical protein